MRPQSYLGRLFGGLPGLKRRLDRFGADAVLADGDGRARFGLATQER
jgi:hypothetical protein